MACDAARRPGDPDGLITVILAQKQRPLNGTQVVDYVYAALSPRERTTATATAITAATSAAATAAATATTTVRAIKTALNTKQSQVNIPIGKRSGLIGTPTNQNEVSS